MKENSLLDSLPEKPQKPSSPVTCLGMTFENDEARRAYFIEELRKKLQDPEFRKIEGFPIGSDEDILALSDPPFYTACPNPFLAKFVACYGRAEYNEQQIIPFASDVSVGRYAPESLAHSYHTKVPARAIARYLLHYTRPGDIVLDAFCGSGMTAVAAQLCTGNTPDAKSEIAADLPMAEWGPRYCIAVDLAPAATFITANYLQTPATPMLEQACDRAIAAVTSKIDWMFMTKVKNDYGIPYTAKINHTVWSDVLICDNCGTEIIVWDAAVDADGNINKSAMSCPSCKKALSPDDMERKFSTVFDTILNKTVILPACVPVLISYSNDNGRQKGNKPPNIGDLALLDKVAHMAHHPSTPCFKMLFRDGPWGDTYRSGYCSGTTHVHHFYRPRTLFGVTALRQAVLEPRVHWGSSMLLTATALKLTRMMRFMSDGIGRIQNGVIYFPSLSKETNPEHLLKIAKGQVLKLARSVITDPQTAIISTSSSTDLSCIPNNSVDYIFVDPPFGSNLQYSELNFIWESWLRVFTNATPEAVISNQQNKKLNDYTRLMKRSFKEFFRVLKPGRWITIEFHNSKNSVWNAIQEAITGAGFIVADVHVLDKKQGAFNQVVAASAVKKDLVISAYKPNGDLEIRFGNEAGTEDGVWDFVRTHLEQLPVFASKDGRAEVIAERQNFLLFDRMVAFHVQRGASVPISAGEFYIGLTQHFLERDGMYFLPTQAAEYDKKRMTVQEVLQLTLFVTDEASAIQWLKQQLVWKPQTFQEIHPQFLKEIGGWQKHEKSLELSVILEQNFLRYDGKGPVPEQIHAYLSTNWKELRNLSKDDPTLVAKARDRWYVPDPRKAGDLEKLREKALLKEFEEYKEAKKKLQVFRLEAVRAGFKKAWQERDYAVIIAVAEKLPTNVMEEDPKLLMWYDQAVTRMGGE